MASNLFKLMAYKDEYEVARLPEQIRAYGHVKQASVEAAQVRHDRLLAQSYRQTVNAAGSQISTAGALA